MTTTGPASGVRIEDGGARWVMWGEIDAAVQEVAEPRILAAVPAPDAPLTIDLGRVTFMDSGGLRLLYRALRPGAPPPVLQRAPQRVRDLLEITGVRTMFVLEP